MKLKSVAYLEVICFILHDSIFCKVYCPSDKCVCSKTKVEIQIYNHDAVGQCSIVCVFEVILTRILNFISITDHPFVWTGYWIRFACGRLFIE
jgi:hypothetical protein